MPSGDIQLPAFTQITASAGNFQQKSSRICVGDLLSPRSDIAIHAAYLHVPFCFHKCHYCDFYSIVDNRERQAEFTWRLINEVATARPWLKAPLQTIFIGGGTPTLLAIPLWRDLLRGIAAHLPLEADGEFTVEANPETVTAELADVLRGGGVNRVSIGCQSFNPKHLATLERWHDPANVHRTVSVLRGAGIEHFNLDLIFAVPGQTLDEWLSDLNEAISLQPAHISCYGLVYEPNTPLTVKMRSGAVTPCDQDLEAEMYRVTMQRLADAGYEHYEISNWARIGEPKSNRCQHNMIYWQNQNWWAFGPSASGHVNGLRWKNVPRLGDYLEGEGQPSVVDVERVDEDARIGEAFMLGLRLIEGIALNQLEQLLSWGQRSRLRRQVIERHIRDGLLERTATHVRLREHGLMLADAVLAELI